MKLILISIAFCIAIAKEFLLLNDNLIIIIIFTTIFLYLIKTATGFVTNTFQDLRQALITQFTSNINLLLSDSTKASDKLVLCCQYNYNIKNIIE
jgi:uncharacterized membrane protein YesL